MIVDLRSDTVTRPTAAMRQAMMDAPLGDDVLGDDPTVQRLEAEAARRAGKEAALFTPSGTMANQLAIRGWTQPGDEVLMEAGAHPFNYEAGGPAVIAGVQIRPIAADRGLLVPETVWPFVRPPNDHFAPATLLCVENTANRGGGSVYAQ
ncbi:MAG: DegT/DnrJ/EryC1/StrS family aminotransferase, partial [Myxococcales bacterium]|nr:DegT/DnrJ/EryC1/StrS family aminotransferase [Myxococcales bacterium]